MQLQEVLSPRRRRSYRRRSRRSKLEIYIEILMSLKAGVNKPTQLMYASNLNWKLFQSILETMIANRHVREITPLEGDHRMDVKDGRTKRVYVLTEEGEAVVKHLSDDRDITRLLLNLR